MIKKVFMAIALIVIIVPVALFFTIKLSPVSWNLVGPINEDNTIAIKGFDPVAYYTAGSAVKGDPKNGLKVNNIIYRFSSPENKLMFKTFPDKYVPQYGGYCATAVSLGYTSDIDPQYWHIEDDRLFVFFNSDSRDDFKSQVSSNIIEKADQAWRRY